MKPCKVFDEIAGLRAALALAATVLVVFANTGVAQRTLAGREMARPAIQKFGESAAVFIANQGQWADAPIRFALSSHGVNVGVGVGTVRYQVFQQAVGAAPPLDSQRERELRLRGRDRAEPVPRQMKEFAAVLVGSQPVAPVGIDKSVQTFNYHLGEPARWRENVPSWNAIEYHGIYDGIDLRLAGRRAGIKYEFVVAPGADYRQIRVRCEGLDRLRLREDGSLELDLGDGWAPLLDSAPVIYQEANGQRVTVPGRFVLVDHLTYGFELTGHYDASQSLVIDPELAWSTYVGGGNYDAVLGIAIDNAGNVLVCGYSYSAGWVSGGWDPSHYGDADGFVVKLSPTGTHLWSTYLGGAYFDGVNAVAVDSANNVLVTGGTDSDGWVSYGWDTTLDDARDAFVVKLNPAGAHLWSTYLGGGGIERWDDVGHGIAVDSADNVLVTGHTHTDGWVSGGYDTSHDGSSEGFIVKLSPGGAHLWSTYVGGDDMDWCIGIAVDSANNVFVVGTTFGGGWASGGGITNFGGRSDGFAVKVSPTGQHLWSTYLSEFVVEDGGFGSDDRAHAIAMGGDGAIVIGYSASGVTLSDAWVARLGANGLSWLLPFPVPTDDIYRFWNGVAVDSAGNIFIAGKTYYGDWATGGFNTSFGGWCDGCVTKFKFSWNSGNLELERLWSAYVGGNLGDACFGIAVDSAGNLVVCGETVSADWIGGGWDTSYNGNTDGFVVKISPWVDIGLRMFDGTQTVRIACEAPRPGGILSSPLRIAKDGTTYGIVLTDPSAPTASKIHVQTSSGIKAWEKLP